MRDLFAAFAMAGMLVESHAGDVYILSEDAYKFADAMMEYRFKNDSQL